MFDKVKPDVDVFIEKNRKERYERREARLRDKSSIVIQKVWRGYYVRSQVLSQFRSTCDEIISRETSAGELLHAIRLLSFRFSVKNDRERFELLIRRIMRSIEIGKPDISYLALALRKATLVEWIKVTKWIFAHILHYVAELDPCTPAGSKALNVFLSFLLVVTDYPRWTFYEAHLEPSMAQLTRIFLDHLIQNQLYQRLHGLLAKGLARHSPMFTKTSLTGIFTVALRPLIYFDFSQKYMLLFASQILAVPGFVLHVNSMMNEVYDSVLRERLCSKTVLILYEFPHELDALVTTLDGSSILCFIANLIQLSLLEGEILALHCSKFCVVLSRLLSHLGAYVGSKKSNLSSWHPILGWFAQPLDTSLQAAMTFVTKQLRLLWNGRMVRMLFGDLYAETELDSSDMTTSGPAGASSAMAKEGLAASGSGPIISGMNASHSPVRRSMLTNNRSFDLDHCKDRVRHGLTGFLHQLSLSRAKRKLRAGLASVAAVAGASGIMAGGAGGAAGPNDLPESLKAVCMLYCFTVASLREIRNDILAGLSLGDLLPRLWRLVARCGTVQDWVKVLLDAKQGVHEKPHAAHLLHIFTAAASNSLSILDDVELFELGKSFTVEELRAMGIFFNQLVYETVLAVPDPWALNNSSSSAGKKLSVHEAASASKWDEGAADGYNLTTCSLPGLFSLCMRLLSVIHERDSRHSFTPPDFWLIPHLKISTFLADLRKPKPHAVFLLKNVPHIIPHKERVMLFRDRVREDKASLGVQTRMNWLTDDGPVGAVITIHRNRLVEDGYQQLANLSSAQLRMKIRVQFVNEMGLDEVGIDLDGVFKEFLEETLHRVFDPSLNLFRVTSDQRLYPSPSSHLQENHLLLFEFLGKMLAKAIYEGIVVDVPFANFFLTQLLGRERAGCYSFLDELATLDRELYKSLSYIKHYDGDVADLEFTYSYAEDCLGQVVVHDLCPGGRYITVTNDLKISYVHRVAHFRMYKQIRAQTASFIRGFYAILNPDWLAMFSPPELQKLISGDSISVNIDDLKQNTRYSGGFHSNHRVIKWLWDILRRDFSDEERSLFLKFVTSCSRPPLLGFSNLEPPFCIRCVQYANEDQDVGDTLGSVLKGFFGVGGRREEVSRLPTTSTCFNLLKLPNYSSRSVLRDKLRYAIHSHAGFELS